MLWLFGCSSNESTTAGLRCCRHDGGTAPAAALLSTVSVCAPVSTLLSASSCHFAGILPRHHFVHGSPFTLFISTGPSYIRHPSLSFLHLRFHLCMALHSPTALPSCPFQDLSSANSSSLTQSCWPTSTGPLFACLPGCVLPLPYLSKLAASRRSEASLNPTSFIATRQGFFLPVARLRKRQAPAFPARMVPAQ